MHGQFGLLSPRKAGSHSTALPSFLVLFLCAVLSCFRNPPNSDIDYRIFNMRTLLCMRIHTGVGHTDNESAHFDSEKLNFVVCAPDRIRTSGHGIYWISRPTLCQLDHHVPLGKVTRISHGKCINGTMTCAHTQNSTHTALTTPCTTTTTTTTTNTTTTTTTNNNDNSNSSHEVWCFECQLSDWVILHLWVLSFPGESNTFLYT